MNKSKQLGMNSSTASNRLIKDLLFKFATDAGHKCFRCGEELTRSDFSVEHKVPWLNSENPVELFFDLDNIAYSHLKCNVGAARKTLYANGEHGVAYRYNAGCRCDLCKKCNADRKRKQYDSVKRKDRYIKNGA